MAALRAGQQQLKTARDLQGWDDFVRAEPTRNVRAGRLRNIRVEDSQVHQASQQL